MNQYRCETCSFKVKSRHTQGGIIIDCDKYDLALKYFNHQELINIIGCASHSDSQSEREKVLDEVIEILDIFPPGYSQVGDDKGNKMEAIEYCKIRINNLRAGE